MSTQLISEQALARSRTTRARLVAALGPATMLGGVAWGFLQPYRLTRAAPARAGLLVAARRAAAARDRRRVVFALLIAPGLIEDLEDDASAAR